MKKNKNGFISMTLVYSLLIVFLFLVLSIIVVYNRKISYLEKIEDKVKNDLKEIMNNTVEEEIDNTLSSSWATKLGITKLDIIAIPVETTLNSPETYTYKGVTYNRNQNGVDVSKLLNRSVLASTYTDGTKDVIVMINSRGKTVLPENSSYLFSDNTEDKRFKHLEYIQTENFNTSKVKNMSNMFNYAGYKATTFNLDLGDWDTSNVTNMYWMFYTSGIIATTFNLGNLNNWNTSNVTNMVRMFSSAGQNATTFNLNLSDWDTSKVKDMDNMFLRVGSSATTFNLDLSNWDTSNVTNMYYMFSSAGQNATTSTLNIKGFNLNSSNTILTNYSNVFAGMNSNAKIIVGSTTSKNWILGLNSTNRPSSWTTSNIIVNETP